MEIETEANQASPVELLTVREAARMLMASDMTLLRKIAEHKIVPDAYLLLGTTRKRSALFLPARLNELSDILPREKTNNDEGKKERNGDILKRLLTGV